MEHCNKNQLRKSLLSIVERLVVTHDVAQDDIGFAIKRRLLKLSRKLPKVKVLYSDCYGEFELSDQFLNFRKEHAPPVAGGKKNAQRRTALVPLMPLFGQQMANEHPKMMAAITHYHRYHLNDDVVNSCWSVEHSQERLARLEKVLRKVMATPKGQFHGNKVVPESRYDVDSTHFNHLEYDKDDLIDQIRILIEELDYENHHRRLRCSAILET